MHIIIKKLKTPYSTVLLKTLGYESFFLGSLFLIGYYNGLISFTIPIILFRLIISIQRIINQNRFRVFSCVLQDKKLNLHYHDYWKIKQITLDIEEFEIQLKRVKTIPRGLKLVMYQNKDLVLSQYDNFDWSASDLHNLFDEITTIKNTYSSKISN